MTHQQNQPKTRFPRHLALGVAAALVVDSVFATNPVFADSLDHSGGSALETAGALPNPARCGAFPPNLEVQFTSFGLETVLGSFTGVASACQNTETGEVTDLVAFDTGPNGVISYISDPFTFELDPETCISKANKVKYDAVGISGDYVGGDGHGEYDIHVLDPNCSGEVVPAHVGFNGKWKP